MSCFDTPRTQTMKKFLEREKNRVVGLSIESDGVFIYTNSHEWCDDHGAGTFRGDTETAAIKAFRDRVTKGDGNKAYPQPAWRTKP